MLRTDQAIRSKKEDLLGTAKFAQSLGDAGLVYKGKDSIVLGLFGPWGYGKSSIVNMALEHVEDVTKNVRDNAQIIVKFNPWHFSDQSQLINQFFRELSIALRNPNTANTMKRIGSKLEVYSKLVSPLQFIPLIGQYAGIAEKTMKSTGQAMKSMAELKDKDLESVKSELSKLLEKQAQRILIIINDIDRLHDEQIREIIQLVKSVADFPYLIYLLVFDKSVVAKALDKTQEGYGMQYMEKVIQVPFDIPPISNEDLQKLLLSKIDEIIAELPQEKFDQEHWGNIYHGSLKFFFRTLRDVNRYINSLSFGYQLVKNEANAIDFIAITGIQVFAPKSYDVIKDNKEVLTHTHSEYSFLRRSTDGNKDKQVIDRLVDQAPLHLQEYMRELIGSLFSDRISSGYEWASELRRTARICSPDAFDIYFKLTVPKCELSKTEMEHLISNANSTEAFSSHLLSLYDQGKIIKTLERLEDYTRQDIREQDIGHVVKSLMDVADLFPFRDNQPLSLDTLMRISRVFYQLLHRIEDKNQRLEIYKSAIEGAEQSLYMCVSEVALLGQQHGKLTLNKNPQPEDKQTLTLQQVEELETLALTKIEQWAKDGRLAKSKYLLPVLYRWRDWRGLETVKVYLRQLMQSSEGLIILISAFLRSQVSIGKHNEVKGQVQWINLTEMSKFLDIGEVEFKVSELLSSGDSKQLNGDRKGLLNLFIDCKTGK